MKSVQEQPFIKHLSGKMEVVTPISGVVGVAETDLAAQTIVPLPSIFDARTLDATRDVLSAAFEMGRSVVLDASQVERMGTLAIQLMMSAARTAEVQGVSFSIKNTSSLFRNVVAELGLTGHFSHWVRS